MPGRTGFAAEQAKQPVGVDRPGRPGFLPVDHVVITLEHRLAGNCRHVRTGIGLRPALRPHVQAGSHARQEALFLFRGAELHQGRPQQQLAILVDAHRRVGAVILFLENQPLDQIAAATAQFRRPHHH